MKFVVDKLTAVFNSTAKAVTADIKGTAKEKLAPLYRDWREHGADCKKKEPMISFLKKKLEDEIESSLVGEMETKLTTALRMVEV